MATETIERDVGNILAIFKEVTGIAAERTREEFVIRHWLERGLTLHDFRLLLEYHFNSPTERAFLDKPGNMNLRMILNPNREGRIRDILQQLQHAEKIKKLNPSSVPKTLPTMLMKCGLRIPLGDKESYDGHMDHCFQNKGLCFV